MKFLLDESADFPTEASADVWLRVTVGVQRVNLQTLLGDFSVSIPAVRRNLVLVGGMASMVGGAIWIALFLLLQLEVFLDTSLRQHGISDSNSLEVAIYNTFSFFLGEKRIVFIPPLLFILGSLGLYARLATPSIFTKIGLFLTLLGLILATWLGMRISDYDYCCGVPQILWSWFSAIALGDFFISLGLIFLGVPIIKARVLPKQGILLLIISAWFMKFMLYLIFFLQYISFHFEYFPLQDLLAQYGIFTASALLFGAGWVWLGRALWLEKSARLIEAETANTDTYIGYE